jgi:hypothetical protein
MVPRGLNRLVSGGLGGDGAPVDDLVEPADAGVARVEGILAVEVTAAVFRGDEELAVAVAGAGVGVGLGEEEDGAGERGKAVAHGCHLRVAFGGRGLKEPFESVADCHELVHERLGRGDDFPVTELRDALAEVGEEGVVGAFAAAARATSRATTFSAPSQMLPR